MSFENPTFPTPQDQPQEPHIGFPGDSAVADSITRMNEEDVPEAFEKSEDILEPEYMQGISEAERRKILWAAFLDKTMDWFESPDGDPQLEEALRQSEDMKQIARWASHSYVDSGFITEEQRVAKLRLIGMEDLS